MKTIEKKIVERRSTGLLEAFSVGKLGKYAQFPFEARFNGMLESTPQESRSKIANCRLSGHNQRVSNN